MSFFLKKTPSIVGVFEDDTVFIDAIKEIRKRRFSIKDAFTPFPVHGLDKAMGLAESKLGYAAFIFGAIGATIGVSLMTYTMHISWPLNIGGKPSLPIPSFIPITFELTVLIASLGMVGLYLMRNNMLPGMDPKIYHNRATQDRFVVLIEEENLKEEIVETLKELGASEIKEDEYVEQKAPLPLPIKMK